MSVLVAASTSSIAWLLDPAIKKIFIEKDQSLLLIIPGFVTDVIGFLLIFPLSRKTIFNIFKKKFKFKKKQNNNFIEGDYEDIEDNDDRKI